MDKNIDFPNTNYNDDEKFLKNASHIYVQLFIKSCPNGKHSPFLFVPSISLLGTMVYEYSPVTD